MEKPNEYQELGLPKVSCDDVQYTPYRNDITHGNRNQAPPAYHEYDVKYTQRSQEPPVVHVSVESNKSCANRYWIIAGVVVAILLVISSVAVTLLMVQNKDNYNPGQWSEWTEWSDCSVTCDTGIRYRERQCPAGECHGMETESSYCFDLLCPAEYGTWSTWGSWSTCGQTCGSSKQERARQCNIQDDQLNCAGTSTQNRECNNGDCPDCNKPCNGNWEDNCRRCTCVGNTASGRVLTEQGEPINNVKISPLDMPYYNIATTDTNGIYNLTDLCIGDDILFHRDGFVRLSAIYQTSLLDITLIRIEPLTMTKELMTGARLVGGCIELTCETRGQPGPDYVEWIKNGRSIGSGSNILKVENLKKDDSGMYQCRANNDYSSIYSRNAMIKVEESTSDFCNPSPMKLYKDLPHGCLHGEETRVNVGQCMRTSCSFGEEACAEETKSRCGVVQYDEVELTCGAQSLPVMVAKQCGCLASVQTVYEIRGVALAADDGKPVYFANITVNGEFMSTTDFYGQFHIQGDLVNPRVVVTFTPTTGNFAVYSTVLTFDEGNKGTEYMTVRIQRRLPPINRNANSEIEFSLGNNQYSSGFGQISIPANSLQNIDGTTYQGEAAIHLELADVRDMGDLEIAPGDFSAIDEEGSDVMLQSTGMFRLDIEDLQGNDLVLTGNVKITIQNVLNNDAISQTKLWSLDENTGRWKLLTDFKRETVYDSESSYPRPKRQLNFGNFSTELESININRRWSNFDQVSTESCYSKIRVYETNEFDTEINTYARVMAISGTSETGYTRSEIRAYSDPGLSNGQCIIHPCDTYRVSSNRGYNGYIIGTHMNEILHPSTSEPDFPPELNYETSEDAMKARFILASTSDGPLYDYDGSATQGRSSACSGANTFENHFRFYKHDTGACQLLEMNRENDDHGDSWYKWKPSIGNGHMFVKVFSEWEDETRVRSMSFVGQNDDNSVPLKEGEWYGTREDCTENQAVCLELKTSGLVGQNGDWSDGVLSAFNISLVDIDFDFEIEIRDTWNTEDFEDTFQIYDDHVSVMLLSEREEQYGRGFGIYYDSEDKRMAEYKCRKGQAEAEAPRPAMTQDNWAFKLKRKV